MCSEELKPCPFCGNHDLGFDKDAVWPDAIHMAWVVCHGDECDCRGPRAFWYDDLEEAKSEAVKLWNQRAKQESNDGKA